MFFKKIFYITLLVFSFQLASAETIQLNVPADTTAGKSLDLANTPTDQTTIESIRNALLTNGLNNTGNYAFGTPGTMSSVMDTVNQGQLSQTVTDALTKNIADGAALQGLYDANKNDLGISTLGALSTKNDSIVNSDGKEVVPEKTIQVVTDDGGYTYKPTAAQIKADQAADPTRIYAPSSQVTVLDLRSKPTDRVCSNGVCSYQLLAPIPAFLGDSSGKYQITQDTKSLCSLLNQWFRIGIALAGMLAVVMIVLGGFQYATTDSLFNKDEGKGKIQNALWGLLLALTTWLVLNTINPALTNCELVVKPIDLKAAPTATQNVIDGAVMGGLMGGVIGGTNPLQPVQGSGVTQSKVDYDYDQVYSQFTEQDYKDLADGNAGAQAKWEGIQMQLDNLNTKYADFKPATGMTGSANSDALSAANAAFAQYGSAASNQRYMGVMDYSQSSSEPRFMIVDRETGQVTYTQAAHGKGSDPNNTGYATQFSDVKGQNTSELGAFVATPYYSTLMGKNALSLDGLEASNQNAGNTSNGKAIHTSDYVVNNGEQCGRSLGCIAVPNSMGDTVLTKLSNAFIYSYYPQK